MVKSWPKLFKDKTLDFSEIKVAFHKHLDFAHRQHRRYYAVTSVTKYSLPPPPEICFSYLLLRLEHFKSFGSTFAICTAFASKGSEKNTFSLQ